MRDQNENQSQMIAIKIPQEHTEFLRANPKFAEKISKLVIGLTEAEELVDLLKKAISSPGLFEKYLEKGTVDQLNGFIQFIVNRDKLNVVKVDIPREKVEEFKKEFSAKMGGKVVTTDVY